MGKPKEDKLKVIFKTSMTTLCTHSKTCSLISQLSAKSAMLRMQKNLGQKHSYYLDRGKVKRDLSMETDICVLRRFCRRKMNKTSTLGSSAKSKYSAVDTEAETVEEFPDASACGDNEILEIRSNYPTDLDCLMVDNLKNLLAQWIRKHLTYNNDMKQKLNTVFESLLHKLHDKEEKGNSSDTTYIVHKEAQDQEVKEKTMSTGSNTFPHCNHKSCRKLGTSTCSKKDSPSAPIHCPNKDLRIISTLSIPRTFNKRGSDRLKICNSSGKLGKPKRKNIILSIDKFNKLLDSSSFDLMAVSTNTLTKRFQNDVNLKKKNHIVVFPKSFYKSATCSKTIPKPENVKNENFISQKRQLSPMPSLLRSLYLNDTVSVTTIVDKNSQYNPKNDNSTMTEDISRETGHLSNKSEISVKNPTKSDRNQNLINDDIKCLNVNKTTYTSISHLKSVNKKSTKRGKVNKRRKQVFGNKITPNSSKLSNPNSKHFTFLYEKATSQILQGQDLLRYWQNLFQYFSEHNSNNNVKVDIHISMSPKCDYSTKDAYTYISNDTPGTYEMNADPKLLYNVEPEIPHVQSMLLNSQQCNSPSSLNIEIKNESTVSPTHAPEIIPLLDGALSHSKYIINVNSREKSDFKSNVVEDRCTVTSELEILQEISELKVVIKDLALTTEKLVSKHTRKDSIKSNTFASFNASYNFTSSSICEAVINLRNPSKATQIFSDLKRTRTKSTLDTCKDSKTKDTLEYYNRLSKKSTSYRIIDSESLLRVTDMTSKAIDFNHQYTDEGLTCSLPKSKSLFELSADRNKKLIAFFCDNCIKPKAIYSNSSHKTSKSSKSSGKNKKWCLWGRKKKKEGGSSSGSSCVVTINPELDGGYSCTSSCHFIRGLAEDDELCKYKGLRGMGFGEGCLYCMLLWIPVIILGCLFYHHVLKSYLVVPKEDVVLGRSLKPVKTVSVTSPNSSVLYLKLSELGF